MKKIAFIGAGSLGFSRRLMIDILSFPALQDCMFSLMDIDEFRLGYVERIAKRIIDEGGYPAKFEVTTDRKKAIEGADYVIIMILANGFEAIKPEIEIPLKYGVDQCIGDTTGPGGIFRGLRTIPMILDICRDVEKYAPNAFVLNYTNPMSILCTAMNKATSVRNVGLCHSVQGTAALIANWVGIPYDEFDYLVAGINHQAWFLKAEHNGKSVYPTLREKIADEEIYNSDTTRFEMFKHLDYFVTESSGHNSEYNPWFRKRPDLLQKYTPGGSWNGGTGFILQLYGKDREDFAQDLERMASGEDKINFNRSNEYGSQIINAMETDAPFRFNGNVANNGFISNLPTGSCVEVPCYADSHGLSPMVVGALPSQLVILNQIHVAMADMTVEASLTGNKRLVFQAIAHDPLTSAVLSLQEIEDMVDELFASQSKWLPQFK
ncbi:MAG: alpha-galactosidase [Limnochordia bacterium]|nr:alpha-galactosidase [Limnochordia bacterium]MDD2629309.1 alpha-galactosidase [Limnochordia bacterium]MDD4517589.1 alpha-galactosidase [Limnochordia bacterium]